jgi:hypothetical protein
MQDAGESAESRSPKAGGSIHIFMIGQWVQTGRLDHRNRSVNLFAAGFEQDGVHALQEFKILAGKPFDGHHGGPR